MKLTIATSLIALALAGASFAQPPAPTPAMQEARKAMMESCAADMKKLCDGKEGREAMMCMMRDNRDAASQPCKDAMAKVLAARQAAGGQSRRRDSI